MTTPADQTVPEDFQNTLDLPEADIDPAALAKAQTALNAAYGNTAKLGYSIGAANHRITGYKAALMNKRLSAKERAVLEGRIKTEQAAIASQTKARAASIASYTGLQNNVYVAGGQYDKLLSGTNKDAFLALKSLFNTYGLGSLAGKIYDYVKQGYGADTISLLLQDTTEYKTRFAANTARAKAGLPVLSPAEYLATESAYRQVLSAAGLPKGFYDNPADFTKWISEDVSATEIKNRVDLATDAVAQSDPERRRALYEMYGINEADLTAYFLDRKTAEPILKKQAAAAAIGAAAIRRGFTTNTSDMEDYATLGITGEQADQGYAQIADSFSTMLGLAGRYGDFWNQRLAEQEVLTPGATTGGQESASAKGKRLRSQERALFSGSQGSSIAGLNAGFQNT